MRAKQTGRRMWLVELEPADLLERAPVVRLPSLSHSGHTHRSKSSTWYGSGRLRSAGSTGLCRP